MAQIPLPIEPGATCKPRIKMYVSSDVVRIILLAAIKPLVWSGNGTVGRMKSFKYKILTYDVKGGGGVTKSYAYDLENTNWQSDEFNTPEEARAAAEENYREQVLTIFDLENDETILL